MGLRIVFELNTGDGSQQCHGPDGRKAYLWICLHQLISEPEILQAGARGMPHNVSGNNAARLRTIQQSPEAAVNPILAAGGAEPVSKRVERF